MYLHYTYKVGISHIISPRLIPCITSSNKHNHALTIM